MKILEIVPLVGMFLWVVVTTLGSSFRFGFEGTWLALPERGLAGLSIDHFGAQATAVAFFMLAVVVLASQMARLDREF